MRVSVGGRCIN